MESPLLRINRSWTQGGRATRLDGGAVADDDNDVGEGKDDVCMFVCIG